MLVTLLVAVMKCLTEQPEGEEVYLGVQGHTKGLVPCGAEVRMEQLPAWRRGNRGKDAQERDPLPSTSRQLLVMPPRSNLLIRSEAWETLPQMQPDVGFPSRLAISYCLPVGNKD